MSGKSYEYYKYCAKDQADDHCSECGICADETPPTEPATEPATEPSDPCPGGILGSAPDTSKFQEINRWGTWEECLDKCKARHGCKAVVYGFDWAKKDCTLLKDTYNDKFQDDSYTCVANI